eukprot:1778557-Pyramimonas_sp.AAC.2
MATGLPGPEKGPRLFPRRRRGGGGGQRLAFIPRFAANFRALPSHDGRPRLDDPSPLILAAIIGVGWNLKTAEIDVAQPIEWDMVEDGGISNHRLLTRRIPRDKPCNLMTSDDDKAIAIITAIHLCPLARIQVSRTVAQPLNTRQAAIDHVPLCAMGRDLTNTAIIKFIMHLCPPVGPHAVRPCGRPRIPSAIHRARTINVQAGAWAQHSIEHQLEDGEVLAVSRSLEGCLRKWHYPPDVRLDDPLPVRNHDRPSRHSQGRQMALEGRAVGENMHARPDHQSIGRPIKAMHVT